MSETEQAIEQDIRPGASVSGRRLRPSPAIACVLLAACATSARAAPPDAGAAPARVGVVVKNGKEPFVLLHRGGNGFMIARRGHLGVQLIELTPELREHFGAPKDAGILVARLTPDSPAVKAGLRVGDILTTIDGQKIGDESDLRRQVRSKADKDTATVELLRNRSRQTVKVQIEHKETPELDIANLIPGDLPRFQLDRKRIDDALNQAMRNLNGPELRQQLDRRRDSEEKLQQRTRALEERLERLERQLQGKK